MVMDLPVLRRAQGILFDKRVKEPRPVYHFEVMKLLGHSMLFSGWVLLGKLSASRCTFHHVVV